MAAYKDEQRGTWYVSFHYYDWTGKNCRKVKRGFKTKREATEWEHHFRMKEAADLDMTFGEFVQAYTRDMKPKLKHNTWLTKEHILRTKLLPYFENKKMCDIRAKDIIQWQNEQISYRDEKGKPYAPTYLKTLQSELSALFNHAVRFYELKSNPVVKAGPLGKGKAEEMLFWTKEEYLKFIEKVKDKPYSYQAFQILYWCGLRVGDLRHSHASLLISKLGAQPNLVAERLGHEKIQTTLNTYSHLYPNQSRDLADQLNDLNSGTDDEQEGDDSDAGET